MREAISRGLTSPFDYLKRKMQGPSEDEILWALRDVSFEVKEGEGIIGRNGAGKSTPHSLKEDWSNYMEDVGKKPSWLP